jgi:hypothetical protein
MEDQDTSKEEWKDLIQLMLELLQFLMFLFVHLEVVQSQALFLGLASCFLLHHKKEMALTKGISSSSSSSRILIAAAAGTGLIESNREEREKEREGNNSNILVFDC